MRRSHQLIYRLLILFFLPLTTSAQEAWSPEQLFYGKGGKLTYTPDEQGNIIPDFSHVGYRYGDEPIPDIPVVVEVEPVEGDDGATIQAAINSLNSKSLDANGFRGAVLLKKGTYQVAGQIKIANSGIVLRGEGDTDEGTIIIAEGTSQRELIKIDNGSSRSVISSSRVSIIEDYVPIGRKFVVVSNASGFAQGDQIVLYRPGTTQWINDLKMNQIPPRSDGLPVSQWSPSSYNFYFERLVTRVNGDTIFFRNPVVMALEKQYGGGAVYKYSFNRIQNIGVENLCLKSTYAYETDENHSWTGIAFHSVENGWVRNVTSWYFSFGCVDLKKNAKLITVENCHVHEPKSVITGSRRYSFYLSGSLNLFRNLTSDNARHDYASNAYVTGPNVFSTATATNTHADIGPHHRWAMGTLYEKIVSDGEINVQDRGNMGSGHGWAGANQVFWNCEGSASVCQNPWVSAKNYNFGFIGLKRDGANSGRPDGVWAGHNVPGIFPASLYEAQLDERLNGTTRFMALYNLIQQNDTSFLMSFTLPLMPEQITNSNFQVTGTVDIESEAFSVTQKDEYSVIITSSEFKTLPNMAKMVVRATNLTSQDGKTLQGITSASLVLPDKRPVVTGESKFVSNINGSLMASSSRPGTIYFVKYNLKLTSRKELDSLVSINQGRKVEAPEANIPVTIYTNGLPGDYYQYYSVDESNMVSAPSTNWAVVTPDGPATGLNAYAVDSPMTIYQDHGKIVIDPKNEAFYSLEIYTITGQLLYQRGRLTGVHTCQPENIQSILLIKTESNSGVQVFKLLTN